MERQFGDCRCCLIKGNHRSLLKEYNIDGKRVVFKEFILECFNVFLSSNSNLPTLICEACIRRLREAQVFRKQMLRTETQLLKTRGIIDETEFVDVLLQQNLNAEEEPVDIKQETESCGSPPAHYEECELEDEALVPGEKELLERFSADLPRLPTKHDLYRICPVFYRHLDSLKGKIVKANTIQALSSPRMKKKNVVAISEKLAQAINAATLLENSNATVFKSKMRCGFPCFYCRNIFVNPKTLREHQTLHPKALLYKLLTKYTADALVVYADITDLKCSICNENVYDLDTLKNHLTDVHNKKMYVGYSDRVIPFKLENKENNFECILCGRSFETFGATDRHMNEHFSNYVCEECGSGFVTKHRLKVHTYLLHSKHIGVIKCEPCKKIFASKFKFKIHNECVHKKLKKMQCSQCSDKFIDFFSRQRHMEEKHGVEILSYKCSECDRAFNRKYTLTCHVKRIHLAKKDVQCDLCPFMCFNRSELKEHMYKHGGEKTFECTLCQKSFARKKTLTIHMRVHSDDKKYSCHFCGESFVQNSSLKTHLKTHYSEYVDL